jgi:hypothetical protein
MTGEGAFFRHPEVLVAQQRASKGDGPSIAACTWRRLGRSSFEARLLRSLAPQDDGEAQTCAACSVGRGA